MTYETVPDLMYDWPELRKWATRLSTVRRQQKHALRRSVSKSTPVLPQVSKAGNPVWSRTQWREEGDRLWSKHQEMEFALRDRFRPVQDKLRSYLVREVGRLEDLVGEMEDHMVSDAWRLIYLIRAAALIAWDGPATEIEAGIAKFRETDVFRELSRLHNKRRTRRRLEAGYWSSPALKKERKEASRTRRASMTEEERRRESEARSERRRLSKSKSARRLVLYSGLLDEHPVESEEPIRRAG